MVYLLKTRAPFQGAAFLEPGGDSAAALLGESGNEDLNARRLAQGLGLVGALPGHVDVRAAEVAVGGRLTIDGLQQIEHGDDAARTQVEDFANELDDPRLADFAGAEGIDRDRGRFGDADGVGHLDLAAVGDAGGDDVLGDITSGVGGGAVDFARVFAGEGSAAVARHAAVGGDDDLAAGEAAVAYRAADDEAAGRVHEIFGVLRQPLFRHYGFNDFFYDGLNQAGLANVRLVLSGKHHGLHRPRLGAVVTNGDLALGDRTQPRHDAVLAQLGLAAHEAVRIGDRRGHQHVGLVGGVAEHHALVAGALFMVLGLVHAHGDVGGLLADGGQHRAGLPVETHLGTVIADLFHSLPHHGLGIDPGLGGDFAGEDDHAGLHQGLAGDAGLFVLDLVCVLVCVGVLVVVY